MSTQRPPGGPGPSKIVRLRSVRHVSEREFLGLPWLAIAFGPDPSTGEARGHARGVIALGDIATGVIAFGGLARGVIALGGLAVGLFAFGGLALGAFAFGGAAIGGVAIGGGALGIVAVGGAAVGYYAAGGAAIGTYAMSPLGNDPEAVEFFRQFGDPAVPRRLR
jgi:hypothetical protein